jgi:hypothetical protein
MAALTHKEIDNAWAIMGATPAGRNARQLLIDCLSSLCPQPHDPSALLAHEGRRILARELLSLLDKEAIFSDGPDDPSPAGRAGISLGPRRSVQRRIDPEPDAGAR